MEKNPVDLMAAKWPSEIVSRSEIGAFTGGMLSPGTMANLDCKGEGPAEIIKIGRKAGYPLRALVPWLKGRCKIETGKRPKVSAEC